MPDPGMPDPGMADPGMADPGMADPGMADPGMADPGMADPGTPGAGTPDAPPGAVLWLVTSPRAMAGTFTWPVWLLLQRADRVLTDVPDHPQRRALVDAGVHVEVVEPAGSAGSADVADLAAQLYAAAVGGAVIVWLAGGESGAERGSGPLGLHGGAGGPLSVELSRLDALDDAIGGRPRPRVDTVVGSVDPQGARLIDLVAVMDRLRRECPWVQRQTHRSLVRYLLEEAYETIASIEALDTAGSGPEWERQWAELCEELGDLVFQVVFHARLAAEHPGQPWTIDDVAVGITEKLIRRNPHVFGPAARGADVGGRGAGGPDADRPGAGKPGVGESGVGGPGTGESGAGELGADEVGADEVAAIEAAWDAVKEQEKQRRSPLDGVPFDLPALALADKVIGRMRRAGEPIATADLDDVVPEWSHAEVGDALLAIVGQAQRAGVDPEQALRDAVRRALPPSP